LANQPTFAIGASQDQGGVISETQIECARQKCFEVSPEPKTRACFMPANRNSLSVRVPSLFLINTTAVCWYFSARFTNFPSSTTVAPHGPSIFTMALGTYDSQRITQSPVGMLLRPSVSPVVCNVTSRFPLSKGRAGNPWEAKSVCATSAA